MRSLTVAVVFLLLWTDRYWQKWGGPRCRTFSTRIPQSVQWLKAHEYEWLKLWCCSRIQWRLVGYLCRLCAALGCNGDVGLGSCGAGGGSGWYWWRRFLISGDARWNCKKWERQGDYESAMVLRHLWSCRTTTFQKAKCFANACERIHINQHGSHSRFLSSYNRRIEAAGLSLDERDQSTFDMLLKFKETWMPHWFQWHKETKSKQTNRRNNRT